PQKREPMFTLEERIAMIRECVGGITRVKVDHFRGLLADYIKEHNGDVIIKGLRVVSDFESEMSTALMNRSLSEVDTMFLMSDQRYSFISSSMVKEVFFLGGDVAAFVPDPVMRFMSRKRESLRTIP
ncbi:MAG: pantetheine-phosphate adenylyltransferase, partial [Candidatus Eremiobacteraeota bacterium]|nr:pantetheine-phosphate adenylyltransferase [Candidatus Eremiobacteraeota bacterium]